MLNTPAFIDYLRERGIVEGTDVTVTPLAGGVSGEVVIVRSCERTFVVKRALPKLNVKEEWYSDAGRNLIEYRAIEFVRSITPEAVPRLMFVDPEEHLFAMEYFTGDFANWKRQLFSGEIRVDTAIQAAKLLATIHNATWLSSQAHNSFDTIDNFASLRIEPYLIATSRRHPRLRTIFESEAARLSQSRIALVHGDFSPKNILVSPHRLVILDWEVAWFGDPAFDCAFLLNLLFLKSVYFLDRYQDFVGLIEAFRRTYAASLSHFDEALELRIAHLTLLLMLARIDGKSPAEYFTDEGQRQLVRDFVTTTLLENCKLTFSHINARWRQEVVLKCQI
jgi:5-methylthioribose kinase